MQQDRNYNIQVEFDNGDVSYIFAQRLSNEGLNHWQGWKCSAGSSSIYIYESEIYGGECRNDYLGTFGNWDILQDFTVCTKETCGACMTDLLQEKHK